MCTICASIRPYDLSCVLSEFAGPDGGLLRATIREGADAPERSWTPYRMAPGDAFEGTVAFLFDMDWVAIRLEAGRTYQFDLTGTSLGDPLFELYGPRGGYIATNDDGGPGLNSRMVFTANETAIHYLGAGAFSTYTGTYQLTARELSAPVAGGSTGAMADYLVRGYWADINEAPRAFDTRFDNVLTVDLSALSGDSRLMARAALQAWSSVADIRFQERQGQVDLSFSEDRAGAYAQTTIMGTRIISSTVNIDREWLRDEGSRIGTYTFQTYMHEIGHALGLGHQGPYNGGGTFAASARFANDSWQASVMSYFSQSANHNVPASRAYAATVMPADILAIQQMYGAAGAGSLTAGNTVYGVGHTLGDSWLGRIFTAQSGTAVSGVQDARAVAMTIYDAGGFDILNFGNDLRDQRVDLRMGAASDVYGLRGNLQIVAGTVIEGYTAGSGNDVIIGNAAGNLLRGGAGHDRLEGLGGNDTLHGGQGNDTLLGGAGNDRLFGDAGNDVLTDLLGNNALFGGAGNDTLTAGPGNDTLHGDAGNDRIVAGVGHDVIYGGTGADTILSGPGNDWAMGGPGNDLIDGGMGNDTLLGGPGNDILRGGAGNDALSGGTGNDRIEGGPGHDLLRGEQGNDLLLGQLGNDTLVGGLGSDTMTGGAGADVFRFFSAAESSRAAPDLILDFNPNEDLLDLRTMNLTYVGNGPHAGGRSLRWDHADGQTRIFVDVDADRQSDMLIRLAGRVDLDADAFLL